MGILISPRYQLCFFLFILFFRDNLHLFTIFSFILFWLTSPAFVSSLSASYRLNVWSRTWGSSHISLSTFLRKVRVTRLIKRACEFLPSCYHPIFIPLCFIKRYLMFVNTKCRLEAQLYVFPQFCLYLSSSFYSFTHSFTHCNVIVLLIHSVWTSSFSQFEHYHSLILFLRARAELVMVRGRVEDSLLLGTAISLGM